MYYTSVEDVIGTDRDASGSGWRSRRLMLAKDGLPFSVHETTVAAGTELHLCYQILRIEEDTRFLCIFEPALEGQEEAD
jgi:hypothetical protein